MGVSRQVADEREASRECDLCALSTHLPTVSNVWRVERTLSDALVRLNDLRVRDDHLMGSARCPPSMAGLVFARVTHNPTRTSSIGTLRSPIVPHFDYLLVLTLSFKVLRRLAGSVPTDNPEVCTPGGIPIIPSY